MTFPDNEAATDIGSAPMSLTYPIKTFFWTADPQALIDNGYDYVKVEKQTGLDGAWSEITDVTTRIPLAADRFNYHFVDKAGVAGDYYRAVLMDSTNVEPDIPQPRFQGVDTAYEAIMTVDELREIYLWGNDSAFVADDGRYQPEYTFVHNILYGIDKVEKKLALRLLPTLIEEFHDLDDVQHKGSGFPLIPLDEYPVLQIKSVTRTLPGGEAVSIPESYWRVDKSQGILELVPTGAALPSDLASLVVRPSRYIPQAWKITYLAGFDPTVRSPYGARGVPPAIKEAVGKEAAFGPLNVGGDLVGGAGLAGTSLSMDGLSQSVTTTNSSTNAGFGARLIQYEKELKVMYRQMRTYYKRIGISVA